MKHLMRSLFVVLACTLLVVAADKEPAKVKLSADEQAVLDLVNAEREKNKLKPLTVNALLFDVARAHSDNMARQGKLAHDLDGKNSNDRVKEAGGNFLTVGENIGAGTRLSPKGAMSGWMNSAPHKANILSDEFTDIGIGIVRDKSGTVYYTQVFGTPATGVVGPEKERMKKYQEGVSLLYGLVSKAREKEKRPPMRYNVLLAAAAQFHAMNMARQEKLEAKLDGKRASDRVEMVGYKGNYGAEVIAMTGEFTPKAAFDLWLKDGDEARKILNPDFNEIGIGLGTNAKGEFYYAMTFGIAPVWTWDEKGIKSGAERIIELTNEVRKQAKLPLLKPNAKLAEAATGHSLNMAKQKKLEHVLDGKKPNDRVLAVGYDYDSMGENIASTDKDTPEGIMQSWLDSPVHRKQLLDPSFTEIGVGIVADGKGTVWFTQVFGSPAKK